MREVMGTGRAHRSIQSRVKALRPWYNGTTMHDSHYDREGARVMATEQGEEVCEGWRFRYDQEVGNVDRSVTIEPVDGPCGSAAACIEHETREYSWTGDYSTSTASVVVPFEALAFIMRRAGWTVVEPGGRVVER